MNKKIKQFGFTLAEALIVLAILGVLIISVSPMITKKINKKAETPQSNNVELLKEIAELEENYIKLRNAVCEYEKHLETVSPSCLTSGVWDECKNR